MNDALTAALAALDRHAAGVQSGAAKALSNATQTRVDLADVRAALEALQASQRPAPGFVGVESQLTRDEGDKTLPAGARYRRMLLSGRILGAGSGTLIEDSVIDLPAQAGGIVNALSLWGGVGIMLRRVTVRCRAENRSYRVGAGIHGSGFTADSVRIEGFTDGVMGAGVRQRSYVDLLDVSLGDLQVYTADAPGIVHPTDKKSHADAVQLGGNLTWSRVARCRIGVGNTSGVIITEDAGTHDVAPEIVDNDFVVESLTPGAFINIAKAGLASVTTATIQRNTFPDGTSPARMFIRPEYLEALTAAGRISATGPDANRYASGAGIVPVYDGKVSRTSY